MKVDAKVVSLNPASTSNAPASSAGRLPEALTQIRDSAVRQLQGALQGLFDTADDTFFELADKASSNAEQNGFFEAMRELRLKRKQIERGLLQGVLSAFETLNQYEIGRAAPLLEPVSFDNLSLLQNDKLEEAVALDAMVARVMSRDAAALGQLTTRINTLISRKLEDKDNPLAPRPLCEHFLNACESLGVEIRIKLIILKLFEKSVLGELDVLYAEANQTLIDAGILPELKAITPRRAAGHGHGHGQAQARTPEHPVSASNAADGEQLQAAFGTLQTLLAQLRGSDLLPRREIPADAVPISSGDLMRLLSHLQQHLPQAQQEGDNYNLRQQLDGLLMRASAKSGTARVVGEVDEDVINLVAMLFEFILGDRNLPDSLKALIGRLQIPLIKVAVLDKTFFSLGNHPARRLLNEIASAALGWSNQADTQRDSLYQRIERVVQRLLNEFSDDPAIFSEVLAEFLAFTGDERRRSERLEQRTRDAEEGRARADLARQQVEQALNQRLLGKTLPLAAVQLLQEGWSKVLQLSLLKHGEASPQWQQALEVMDRLIWSVEPHEDPAARQQLLQLVPNLLRALRAGFNEAAIDPFVSNPLFSALEKVHVQALQRLGRSTEAGPASAGRSEVPTAPQQPTLAPLAATDSPVADKPGTAVESPAASPAALPAMVEVIEEIVLLAPGETRESTSEPVIPLDDEALQMVDSLRVGSWIELQEDEEHRLRVKLAAVIKPTGKYIFVNRTGMKVLEKTRMGLAVEFRRGAVRLLDDALLFDRALESVIGNLRRLKGT